MLPPISVIIPIAPGETEWQELVASLHLPPNSEICLACGDETLQIPSTPAWEFSSIRTVSGGSGRAEQMNRGAAEANHDWLWFLHADTRVTDKTFEGLQEALMDNQDALYFFDLQFRNDGPKAMSWNEWAVKWRAGTLKLPFGDQGFLIKRELFQQLGTYREDLSYGEDHVFVWKTHQEGFSVTSTGAPLLTSARKYKRGGWLKVTLLHVWLTLYQAAPEYFTYLKRRAKRIRS